MDVFKGHKGMFEGGSGLPLMAIGWSIVISFAGCWAWLESAHFWAFLQNWMAHNKPDFTLLADGYVGCFIAAAFALLSQWTANFVVLRIRRGRNNFLWFAYGICALYAAVSLHHVHEAMQAPAWEARVEARAAERAADETIIQTNDAFLAQVQQRTLGLDTNTVAMRTNAVSAPMQAAADRAVIANTEARERLASIPALPASRPFDAVDFAVGMIAALLALLEFALYWGIGAPNPTPKTSEDTLQDGAAKGDPAIGNVVNLPYPTKEPEIVPNKVRAGTVEFAEGLDGRALLDELEKAGLIDRTSVWSKVNSYPRASRRVA